MSLPGDVDVIVVGAGAAGVAAGRALARAGVRFVVLEARARIGGRAWTRASTSDGFSPYGLDLGCGWLHSADQNPWVGIAGSLGLTVDKTTPPWQREMPESGFPVEAQRGFRNAQNSFYERMEVEAGKAGDRPAVELLEPGNPWNPLIDAISTYVNGVELDRLSVRDYDNYHDTMINYRVVEGYGTLIARSGAALPIITDCPVQTIDHSGTRIEVTSAKGRISARAVIVTVPTNLLARDVIRFIVSFGRESLFICLLLVMFTSIVLGTGLPTIPTYIITASLAAPALLKLGVPLIVSHMFVFYYGIIADLTPPVALAALAAAPIAKASPDAIGWQACRIAIAGFLIPFMAVYEPALMLQEGSRLTAEYGYWIEVAYVSLKAVLTIVVTGVAAIGFYFARTSWPERVLHGIAAVSFISPLPWSDTFALTLTALLTAWNLFKARRPTPTTVTAV